MVDMSAWKILAVFAVLCVSDISGNYDFAKMYSLPGLGRKTASIGMKIVSNAASIGLKMFSLALNSHVKLFSIFLTSKLPGLPTLKNSNFHFNDGSSLSFDGGRIFFGDFNVKTGMTKRLTSIQWSWSPVNIFYSNVTYVDSDGRVFNGKMSAEIQKMTLSVNLALRPTNCPIKLNSISIGSIENTRLSSYWSEPFDSEQLKEFLVELPYKWEESIPEALLEDFRASAFVRGISNCFDKTDLDKLTIMEQLNSIWYDPMYRLITDVSAQYFG